MKTSNKSIVTPTNAILTSVVLMVVLLMAGCMKASNEQQAAQPRIDVEYQAFEVDGTLYYRFVPPGSSMECVTSPRNSSRVACTPLPESKQ